MRYRSSVPLSLVLAAATLLAPGRALGQELPPLMPDDLFRRNIGEPGQMDERFPPHRVMDNLYYVGTGSLGAFLITTPAGHILVNSCFERTVPLIEQSVEELGFRFEDIRIVLGSHAHGDHMQGDALVKEMTGAEVMAMAEDVPLLERMRPDDKPHPIDRVLRDGDTVTLGGETLVAHLTPGHSPGCTSWELEVEEGGRAYTALINCSVGVNPNYQLWQNPDRPGIVEEYRSSYAKLRAMDVDIPLGSHPGMYDLAEKYPRIGETPNPFIDPERHLYEIAINEQAMELRLAEQRRAAGGAPPPGEPWFGVVLPPPFAPDELQVLSERPAAPAVVPRGEEGYRALDGSLIVQDLETIVGFARESRSRREVGDGQLWGRITGFESGARTVAWAADRMQTAGIADIEIQTFDQAADASLWLPTSWEVRLTGDPAFGAGSSDVVLESAMPLSAGDLPPEGVEAPLVYVGSASAAELSGIDVRGKVAVQRAVPQGHTVFLRGSAGAGAQALLERGAVAVLTVIDLPGNMRSRDIGCGGGACFNIGGRDGRFLEAVAGEAAEADVADRLRARLSLSHRRFAGMSAANAVGVVPGTTRADEYIVVNAHVDSWFDGAGDNGDGLAVLLALARHFAARANRPERSLVFVASAGHHTSGLSGPGNFTAMNPDIVESAVLVINLEHTSQRHITPARSYSEDGYQEWTMDAHEAPIVAGISNGSPFLEGLVSRGIERYGTNFVSAPNPMASGEGGAYRRAGLPVFTTMQGPPMYHTTGEVLEMVSEPGLERMARFTAWFIGEVGRAEADAIGR